jgi:hypothetical protein
MMTWVRENSQPLRATAAVVAMILALGIILVLCISNAVEIGNTEAQGQQVIYLEQRLAHSEEVWARSGIAEARVAEAVCRELHLPLRCSFNLPAVPGGSAPPPHRRTSRG